MSCELVDATWMTNSGSGPFLLPSLLCAFLKLTEGLGEEAVLAFFIPGRDHILELLFPGKVPDHASERASKGLSLCPTSQDAGWLVKELPTHTVCCSWKQGQSCAPTPSP